MGTRGWAYLVAVVTAPFVSLLFGQPMPMLALLPLAVAVAVALASDPGTEPEVRMHLAAHETMAGAEVGVTLTITGSGSTAHVRLDLAEALVATSITGGRIVSPGEIVAPMREGTAVVELMLEARRWGSHTVGVESVSVPGPLRLRERGLQRPISQTLTALPPPSTVRHLVEPFRTNLHSGDHPSEVRGPGVEMAELRPWTSGDSPRSINWRASSRSDDLWVTDRHADRNGDLVLVVDSVVEPGSPTEHMVTDLVDLTAKLVRAYGAGRHRVGWLSLSGHLRWIGLDSGPVHEHRILSALTDTQAVQTPVWMAVDRVFDRALRPPSMVVFVSALLDDAVVGRVIRLARSGLDVCALEVDPTPWMGPPGDRHKAVARRIWHLERAMSIDRMRAAGVAVGRWQRGEPADRAMEELRQWRRRFRHTPI
ncbi:hypothetical protein BH23ACT5_BH23ACT5_21860 [soil metagenome]